MEPGRSKLDNCTMPQLLRSGTTVLPCGMDEKDGAHTPLRNIERIQRIGAQVTAVSSRATSSGVAQTEACLEYTRTQLQKKVANHLVQSLKDSPRNKRVPKVSDKSDCETEEKHEVSSFAC
jgi:hypothetical protein